MRLSFYPLTLLAATSFAGTRSDQSPHIVNGVFQSAVDDSSKVDPVSKDFSSNVAQTYVQSVVSALGCANEDDQIFAAAHAVVDNGRANMSDSYFEAQIKKALGQRGIDCENPTGARLCENLIEATEFFTHKIRGPSSSARIRRAAFR